MTRSLFHHGTEEEEDEGEERVVPTYFAPDFVPSPQFLRLAPLLLQRRDR